MASVIYRKNTVPMQGTIKIPPSKSAAHRAILCAALSHQTCKIQNVKLSADISATIAAVEALGCKSSYDETSHTLTLSAEELGSQSFSQIDCNESGSTLRFLIPVVGALGKETHFTGKGRLPERPLGVYHTLLPQHGIKMVSEGGLPLTMCGQLSAGEFVLPGNISSQFITGLLLALPLLDSDSKIILSSPLESKGYIDLTISIMRDFGVIIQPIANGWHICGGQNYQARDYAVEGDWSQTAFFLSLAAFSGEKISVSGLRKDSEQGDKLCIEEYRKFGLTIWWEQDILCVQNENTKDEFYGLQGTQIDAAQIPDLVPALAVCASGCKGVTTIFNAERLRIKECDRLAAMANALNALGGKVKVTQDGLEIHGRRELVGGQAEGMNDHRVLMALSAAVLLSKTDVEVSNAWSIRKSYPCYYEDYKSLGGIADVVDVG